MADEYGPSYSDVRQAVRDALAEVDKDKGEDLCICDCGTDWVVYQDTDTLGAGTFRRGFKMDGVKAVLTSKPEKVERRTTYETVTDGETPTEKQPKNLKDAAKETKARYKPGTSDTGDE